VIRTLGLAILFVCPALASATAARALPPTALPPTGLPASRPPAAQSSPPAVAFANGDGLAVQTQISLDARLYALTMRTKALPGIVNVRILLPTGYASHPHRRYPVLYLFHGTSGTASDWTVKGNAEPATAGLPLIVVMPDIALNDGGGGYCTNFPDGTQNWTMFHIDELIPWVQANLRTLNTRSERAIAGLSQGGFCSFSYAARYPSLFGEALSFSGLLDIAQDLDARSAFLGIQAGTATGLDGGLAPDAFFGNPISDYLNYADHDPATLAANLRETRLYIYFGDGRPGPFDSPTNPATIGAGAIESYIHQVNLDLHSRLGQLGIAPAVYDPYGRGTHSWPYWNRDLTWSLPGLMGDFVHPAPTPAAFSFMSAAGRYSDFGWTVALRRRAAEISTLAVRGARGFSLAGSGRATVTTAKLYRPGATYTVVLRRQGSSAQTVHLRCDAAGRLHLPVALGPSDTQQEYSLGGPPAVSPGTHVYRTTVSISRLPVAHTPSHKRR
jgi:S-formylglutathione hydrolase FrmB